MFIVPEEFALISSIFKVSVLIELKSSTTALGPDITIVEGSNLIGSFCRNKSLKDKKGVEDGTVKLCKKCDRYLNIKEYFTDDNLKSGIGIVCKDCKVPRDPYFSGYRRRRYRRRW